jgi:hypothetical protein
VDRDGELQAYQDRLEIFGEITLWDAFQGVCFTNTSTLQVGYVINQFVQ